MFGISKYGFKRKTYDDILQELFRLSRDKFGESINLSSKSIYGMFLRIIAWILSGIWQLAEKVYLSGYVRYAEGVQLDRIAGNIGLTRLGKQRATGWVTIKLTEESPEEILIPKGFIVGNLSGVEYITVNDSKVKDEEEVFVQSIEKGKGTNSEASEVTEIITPMAYVDSVTNKEAIVGGKDVETDAEFRKRYYQSLSKAGSSTRASIEASLLQLDEVIDAKVIENDTTETIKGLPRQHIHCLVVGGRDQEIAYTILSTKAAGVGTKGKTVVEVEDTGGIKHKVYFDKGSMEDVSIELTIKPNADYSDNSELLIEEGIEDYLLTVQVGGTVYLSQIIMSLKDIVGIDNVDVKINGSASNYKLPEDSIAKLSEVEFNYV